MRITEQITDRLNKVLPGFFHRLDGSKDDYAATWRRRNFYAWCFMLESAMLLPEFYYGGPDLAPTILKGYIGLVLTLGLLYNASEQHLQNLRTNHN